jgi:hypothetical protein
MKLRSSSDANKVKILMNKDKNVSVKEICEKTGFSKTKVYAIRNYIKTKKKLTPVNKTIKAKRVMNTPSKDNLKAENERLYEFCLEWRDKCDAQQKEIARIQHLYMDSQAVVRYLESKIEQLFKD